MTEVGCDTGALRNERPEGFLFCFYDVWTGVEVGRAVVLWWETRGCKLFPSRLLVLQGKHIHLSKYRVVPSGARVLMLCFGGVWRVLWWLVHGRRAWGGRRGKGALAGIVKSLRAPPKSRFPPHSTVPVQPCPSPSRHREL